MDSSKKKDFVDMHAMRQQEKLFSAPIPSYDSVKIKALRERLQISQAVLAALFNTSLSTVRKWELDDKHPSGPSLKLLDLLDRKGIEIML